MKAIAVLKRAPSNCWNCPLQPTYHFGNEERCRLMDYNCTPYKLVPKEDITKEPRRNCPLLLFEPSEAVELLEEMKANCLKPTASDPKRFVKAEALAYAIEILREL